MDANEKNTIHHNETSKLATVVGLILLIAGIFIVINTVPFILSMDNVVESPREFLKGFITNENIAEMKNNIFRYYLISIVSGVFCSLSGLGLIKRKKWGYVSTIIFCTVGFANSLYNAGVSIKDAIVFNSVYYLVLAIVFIIIFIVLKLPSVRKDFNK